MKTLLINKNKNEKPTINLQIQRVEAKIWTELGFYKHHYLTHELNPSAKCFLFTWDNVPVAFIAILNSPRKGMPNGHSVSRLVILPDYQGLGLSSIILNFCGGILKSLGDDYFLYMKTIHDKVGDFMSRNSNWEATSYNGKVRSDKSTESEGKRYQNRLTRKSYCYKFIGSAIYGYEDILKPIKEMRENKLGKQLSLF